MRSFLRLSSLCLILFIVAWLALHLADEHVPVVEEIGALAADVRVRDLDDAYKI